MEVTEHSQDEDVPLKRGNDRIFMFYNGCSYIIDIHWRKKKRLDRKDAERMKAVFQQAAQWFK